MPPPFPTVLAFGVFALSTLLVSATDGSIAGHLIIHESRVTIPNGFKLSKAAAPSSILDLKIALVQRDPDGLEQALYDVSTPGRPTYRNYLSKTAVSLHVTKNYLECLPM
jgi:tripeptidyl-peptidase-1